MDITEMQYLQADYARIYHEARRLKRLEKNRREKQKVKDKKNAQNI